MNNNKSTWIWVAVVVFVLAGLFVWSSISKNAPSKLDGFATCLKDKGLTFYGAFWCPHCQNQKKMFGSAEKFLPYVECSTPDGNGQLDVCKKQGIDGYPTWQYPDGTREIDVISLERLAEKSGCALPTN
ncbi:MAG: hypothetical protein AAB432_02350 [Patescibacteria group bacterium]